MNDPLAILRKFHFLGRNWPLSPRPVLGFLKYLKCEVIQQLIKMLAHKVIVDIEVQFYLRQIKSVLNLNTVNPKILWPIKSHFGWSHSLTRAKFDFGGYSLYPVFLQRDKNTSFSNFIKNVFVSFYVSPHRLLFPIEDSYRRTLFFSVHNPKWYWPIKFRILWSIVSPREWKECGVI